ncbi:hypothetical protein RP20_CCG013098 [Aedes albopictus]|nr:hypothetical protein RP20_CCG013098 [Aedes albopictus]
MSGTEDEFELSDEDDGDVSDCTISDLDSSSGETDDDYERNLRSKYRNICGILTISENLKKDFSDHTKEQ